ncbi:MAG: hypothetical protein KKH92_07895 [Firmicutes bacterium]|nr:hypothetical protein [Bacillota bacterium]
MKTKTNKRIVLSKKYIVELESILHLSTHAVCAIFASDCANHVLEILEHDFEINYQAKHAILAPHRWVSHDISMIESRVYAQKIHVIAKDEENLALKYLYRACGHAAATPHVKKHAIHATNYAIKSLLSLKSGDTEDVEENERKWQIKRLLDLGLKA